MSGADEVQERTAPARLGPGVLVLVVGPSGAGKDTLLAYARARLAGRDDLVFARRRITRPVDATEDHIAIDTAAYDEGVAQGRFPLHWCANGLAYALGEEVGAAIAAGRTVVANGSRAAVAEARARFARLKVVHVTAPPEVLAARIAARGRESESEVLARLAREPALDAPPELRILNVDAVDAAGERLAAFLQGL
ncbi:phosphonate metabolism protein/1,5-bisphosphokinase (PRPP-forming) PhnN [Ancylobacter sp. WKF20]|uniref:phosphonate metabolism protein/1,5-bisphosphokinase (PRPP-forming) PhnN n=1 Tax=Ancylobacter sp. WKF20 TaxID=3039801 RepID=UPI0024343B77|nr:phosphonate metabolism protein/1,5-bisphosphokinase (PRPP-forming) PhnN [Ancylobacter sp. WKF20]WGD31995.1 phosphonate metabolism protein/1,5-bisphosphokinase (PRPP-forming) PhnN [Ancylobacter sp. WKF20]